VEKNSIEILQSLQAQKSVGKKYHTYQKESWGSCPRTKGLKGSKRCLHHDVEVPVGFECRASQLVPIEVDAVMRSRSERWLGWKQLERKLVRAGKGSWGIPGGVYSAAACMNKSGSKSQSAKLLNTRGGSRESIATVHISTDPPYLPSNWHFSSLKLIFLI